MRPAARTRAAKSAFSERKPYPGWLRRVRLCDETRAASSTCHLHEISAVLRRNVDDAGTVEVGLSTGHSSAHAAPARVPAEHRDEQWAHGVGAADLLARVGVWEPVSPTREIMLRPCLAAARRRRGPNFEDSPRACPALSTRPPSTCPPRRPRPGFCPRSRRGWRRGPCGRPCRASGARVDCPAGRCFLERVATRSPVALAEHRSHARRSHISQGCRVRAAGGGLDVDEDVIARNTSKHAHESPETA